MPKEKITQRKADAMNVLLLIVVIFLFVFYIFPILGVKQKTPSGFGKLHKLFQSEWERKLDEFPEFATYLGDHRNTDRLSDMSLEAIQQRFRGNTTALENLKKIKRQSLSEEDRLNYDLFKLELEQSIEGHKHKGYLMPIDQMGGVQIDFPNLVYVTPFRNEGDYENYLKRLNALPAYVDQIIALLEFGIREGITQPAIILRAVPQQIESQYKINVEESPLYNPFTNFPSEISADNKAELLKKGAQAISEVVFPAYEKLNTFFVGTYIPSARTNISAQSLPNGDAYYQYLVQLHTTTRLTPQKIHEIGLEEVARIKETMISVIDSAGFQGSFKQFVEFLRTSPKFYYKNAEELLNGYRAICKKADPELAKLFGKLPRIPYGVVPIPDYQAPASPTAYYYGPSADGSRPGNFWANTYKLETRPKYEMEALALHEAVPGHHLQIALSQEMEGLPEFRKHGGTTAFVEGWGLYAESLGGEMGFYNDPYSRFGQLTYEMWRACRLVVDTGMHSLGWSRERAIEFLKENTAKTENDIVVEIDRYIAWPGQALAYKIGELKMKELKEKAKNDLGEKFDIRKFHDALLKDGAVPLTVLEEEMNQFIQIGNSKK